MATTYISEVEAAKNFSGVMTRLRAGEEVVIQSTGHEPATLKLDLNLRGSTTTEVLARLKMRTAELGYTPTMDDDFIDDMEEIIRNRKPADHSAWD